MNDLPPAPQSPAAPAPAVDLSPFQPLSPIRFAFLAVAYFTASALLRWAFSQVAELDETEQLITTQTWAWGYGPQPPLYDWIQHAVFEITGPNILGLAIMKAGVLSALACVLFRAFLHTLRPSALAVPATLLLAWTPELIWMSQIDRTHTLLASVGFTLALTEFHRLASIRTPAQYIRLGLAVALTFLSKYNAGLFLVLLFLTALSLPQTRRRLLHPFALLTVAFALVPLLPHALWLADHLPQITEKARTYHSPETTSRATQLVAGLSGLLGALALAVLPPSLALALASRTPSPPHARPALKLSISSADPALAPLLKRYLAVLAVIAFSAPLFFHIHRIRHHWFQPLFVFIPLALFAATASRWSGLALQRLFRSSALVACLVALLIPLHPLFAPIRKKPFRQNSPFPELAQALRTNVTPATTLLADNRWIAGNLRMHLPLARYSVPELPQSSAPLSPPFLLVWNATRQSSPPDLFARHVQQLGLSIPATNSFLFVSAPFSRLPNAAPMKLGYALISEPQQFRRPQ